MVQSDRQSLCRQRTIAIGWEKGSFNAGACGVDGIAIEQFEKQAKERLLAVKEQIVGGTDLHDGATMC